MERTMMLLLIVTAIGCESEDEWMAEMASRHATEQSELSRDALELQAELVKGTQQLVEADAESRRDFLSLEAQLEEQRADIAAQREDLHTERKEVAQQRLREPIVAKSVILAATLLACVLPLALAGYLLHTQFGTTDDHVTVELLVEEIARGQANPEPCLPGSADPAVARIEAETNETTDEPT